MTCSDCGVPSHKPHEWDCIRLRGLAAQAKINAATHGSVTKTDPTNNCPGCGAQADMWCKNIATDCRARVGGVPAGTDPMTAFADSLADTNAATRGSASATKPTNPKDAIGIRKAPMSVVPSGVLAEIGVGMTEGAAKYGRHNYRAIGVRASVYYDATIRHLFSYWEGEDIDPDSGLSHVTKAICSLVVLRDAMMQGKCTDDRPPVSAPFYERLNAHAAAVLDRHADKTPRHYTIADSAP